jgi:hypothetical protein
VPNSNETKSNDAYNQEIDRLLHNIEQNEAVFTENNLVSIVKKNQSAEYLSKRLQSGFINSLDKMTLPNLDNHKTYRAFEANEEFNFENALLIGELLFDTNEMIDGKNYLLVSSNHGIMYRRIFNQLRTRGTILLSSDNINIPTVELKAKEIIEIWHIIAFLSYNMPKPQASLSAIKQLVNELQDELKRT